MQKIYDCIAGSSKRLTWTNSGSVPTGISCALLDAAGTLISSVTATASGNGLYYAVVTHPGSRQWVINEWKATLNGFLWINRQFGRITLPDVSVLP